jgi:hypothetical protein
MHQDEQGGQHSHPEAAVPPAPTPRTLKDELIAAIANEANRFDMSMWLLAPTFDYTATATCGTASCMAGHIEALRPELATQLAPKCMYGHAHAILDHEKLAREIWRREMGEECRLDFLGNECTGIEGDDYTQALEEITREEAIAHIQGVCAHWPQLDRDSSPESY